MQSDAERHRRFKNLSPVFCVCALFFGPITGISQAALLAPLVPWLAKYGAVVIAGAAAVATWVNSSSNAWNSLEDYEESSWTMEVKRYWSRGRIYYRGVNSYTERERLTDVNGSISYVTKTWSTLPLTSKTDEMDHCGRVPRYHQHHRCLSASNQRPQSANPGASDI